MTSAIILAGGSSRRMGAGVDKLMMHFRNLPLLAHALLAFERCSDVDEIVLVAREDRRTAYGSLAKENQISKLGQIVVGGAERQDSVWAGLQAVHARCDVVLIHDGARALVTPEIISQCVVAARHTGAAIPASRVKDTIKRAAAPSSTDSTYIPIETTIDRNHLWIAQTPQTFKKDLIQKAYEPLIRDRMIVTDDAGAVERLGHPVFLVECDPLNIKITTPEDLLMAEMILSRREQKK